MEFKDIVVLSYLLVVFTLSPFLVCYEVVYVPPATCPYNLTWPSFREKYATGHFSQADQDQLVENINTYRQLVYDGKYCRKPRALFMQNVTFDQKLADVAQNYAENSCDGLTGLVVSKYGFFGAEFAYSDWTIACEKQLVFMLEVRAQLWKWYQFENGTIQGTGRDWDEVTPEFAMVTWSTVSRVGCGWHMCGADYRRVICAFDHNYIQKTPPYPTTLAELTTSRGSTTTHSTTTIPKTFPKPVQQPDFKALHNIENGPIFPERRMQYRQQPANHDPQWPVKHHKASLSQAEFITDGLLPLAPSHHLCVILAAGLIVRNFLKGDGILG